MPGRPRVIPTPGHTQGHCAFLFDTHGALFVGDAMCSWNPITGRAGPQLMPKAFNQSHQQAVHSLAALEPIDARAVFFGHGDPWTGGVAAALREARAKAT